jgi:phosphatidate cytidylyltransferase
MNQDLKQRIPIAIVYVLGIVLCMLVGHPYSLMLIAAFYILCLHEFTTQGGRRADKMTSLAAIGLSPIIILTLFYINGGIPETLVKFLAILSSIIFVLNGYYLISKKQSLLLALSPYGSSLWYLLLPFILSLAALLTWSNFPLILLGIFILIWLNDTGAYFTGRALGKNKIAPTISPGKSWEGLIGGTIVSVLAAFIIEKYIPLSIAHSWLVIALIISVTGIIGDLTESSWKRKIGIKDSGRLLQGHGGFLDRLDSFIYSMPFVIFYLSIIK